MAPRTKRQRATLSYPMYRNDRFPFSPVYVSPINRWPDRSARMSLRLPRKRRRQIGLEYSRIPPRRSGFVLLMEIASFWGVVVSPPAILPPRKKIRSPSIIPLQFATRWQAAWRTRTCLGWRRRIQHYKIQSSRRWPLIIIPGSIPLRVCTWRARCLGYCVPLAEP